MHFIGPALLLIGIVFLVVGLTLGRTSNRVSANNGSVAVGRDSNAPITVINSQKSPSGTNSFFWLVWNIISGIASIAGFALTIWPIK